MLQLSSEKGAPLPELEVNRVEFRSIEIARFREWRRTGDIGIRDAIVSDAQGIAIGLARRFRDRGAELDDLIQVAQIGLLHAVDRFDPDLGFPFLSFATPTVLGELRRHFRTLWSVRVPRGLQEASLQIGPALSELQQELQRAPTVLELANRIGLSQEAVLRAMEVTGAFRAASLDVPLSPQGGSPGRAETQLRSQAAEEAFDAVEARATVERLLPLLSQRSRRIVELRYFENLSQVEIAEAVGMSQMHVSRLLTEALEQMSRVLGVGKEDD